MKFNRLLTIIILAGSWVQCKKSPYISEKEISNLTGKNVVEVVEKRYYDASPQPGLEDSVLFRDEHSMNFAIFHKLDKEYQKIRLITFKDTTVIKKWVFIKSKDGYSHSIFLATDGKLDYLFIINSETLYQKFALNEGEVDQLFLQEDQGFEYFKIGERQYRYDSFQYVESYSDKPLFYLYPVRWDEQESWIDISNLGGYTGRAIFTLGFPDVQGDIAKYLHMTKDIPTVRMYNPGDLVYKNGGGKITAQYPMIEITKEPFSNQLKIKLPLYLSKKAGRMYIRAVYFYKDERIDWPLNENDKNITKITSIPEQLKDPGDNLTSMDQQFFSSYVVDLGG